mgnify:CR=1 FL=1
MEQVIREWLELAEMDYGVAMHLFENYMPKPLEIICYHCQQAAEKAIKAVVISKDVQGGVPKSMRDPFFGKGEKISSVEFKKSYNKLTGK